MLHAGDVLLDDGLDLALHEGELLELTLFADEVVLEREIFAELVDADELVVAIFNHERVEIVHRSAVAVVEHIVHKGGVGAEHVLAEGKVGLLVVKQRKQSGGDVGLLNEPGGVALCGQLATGCVEEDGDEETAHLVVVVVTARHTAVVGTEDEDGVVEPGLVLHLLEELPDGVVGIADDLVHGNLATGEFVLILVGYLERVMTRSRENGEEEGFALLRDFVGSVGEVFQVRLVEDGPGAVEVLVVAILVHAVVAVKTNGVAESLETQCGVGSTMEKGGGVALLLEHLGQALQGVVGVEVVAIRLDVARNTRKACRHGIDRANAVSKAILETVALREQRVEEGCVTLVAAAVLVFVEETHVLHREALHEEDHHIEFLHLAALGGDVVDGIEDAVELLGWKEFGVGITSFVQGGYEGEGCVEHDGRLMRFFAVDGGRVLSQRVHLETKAASQPAQREQHGDDEDGRMDGIVNLVGREIGPFAFLFDGIIVEEDEGGNHGDAEDPRLPIAGYAVQHNGAQVALTAKLREDGSGGAAASELEIDDVGHIHHNAQNVDDEEQDFHNLLVLGRVSSLDGQELEANAQSVEVAQRTQVESQSAPGDGHHVAEGDILETVDIHIVENPSREHVNDHENQEIHSHDKARLALELLELRFEIHRLSQLIWGQNYNFFVRNGGSSGRFGIFFIKSVGGVADYY